MIIVVGLVALLAIGGFLVFGKSVTGTARCEGEAIANLEVGRCGKGSAYAAGNGPVGRADTAGNLRVDPNGPTCDKLGRCTAGGANCFAAGTLVTTARGLVPIESVEPGEMVAAADTSAETPEPAMRPVERVVVTDDRAVIELDLRVADGEPETIRVTADHAFWVDGSGWIRAGDLAPGARLHGGAEVLATRDRGERTRVYNLEVAEVHTYLAGRSRLLGRYTCERLPATEALRAAARRGPLWDKDRFDAIDQLAAARDLTPDDYALLADAVLGEPLAKEQYLDAMRAKGRADDPDVVAALSRPWFARAEQSIVAGAHAGAPGATDALGRLARR